MATQHDILDDRTDRQIMEDIYETLGETRAEIRALQVELSLVSSNPTVDRVLDACSRIQWRWSQPTSNQEVQ